MMLLIVIHTFRAKTLEKGKCVCSRKKKERVEVFQISKI